MAGFYMDAPNDRLAWDRDGSLLTGITTGGAITSENSTIRRGVNAEDETTPTLSAAYNRLAVIFPVPTDVTAIFLALSDSTTITVETSKDTTNGLDGTWSGQSLAGLNRSRAVKPNYRTLSNIDYLLPNSTSSDLRGIRLTRSTGTWATAFIRAFHIYGRPSSLATHDRLALWHPTSDIILPSTWLDWGDTPRSSSADKTFRIKNLSSTLTATDIDIYVEALTPGSPSVAAMHTLSDNGGSTFNTTLNIASLDPGEISDVLTIRRVLPSNATVSVWSARLAADVNAWE